MKKVLILEDNLSAREMIEKITKEIDSRTEVFSFDKTNGAYQCAMEKRIDLFIIDIILDTEHTGDTSGLNFVENIRNMICYRFTPIIFVTSLEDARLCTYQNLHCYSFIEKPFDVEYLRQQIKECLSFQECMNMSKSLYFRKDGVIYSVERENIVYTETSDHIMCIHTKQGELLKIPYITVKQMLEEMDSPDFIQCSRNTIVNKKFIQNADFTNRIIQLRQGLGKLEIGLKYKKRMKENFG